MALLGRSNRKAILAVPALLVLAPVAGAQEAEDATMKELMALLETKVTVASKSAESLNSAPGIITVVTRPEIEGFAARNLGQVLNRVVGMALLSPDIFPNQSLVIRGQESTPYNNHVLVLLNGRPMRDPITGGLNGSYWNSFPLAVVEKIEIIRGPGSVLYGSCAYSGVVNIVTRSQQDEGYGGAASIGGGSDGAFTQSGHVLFQTGELKGLVGVTNFMDTGPEFAFIDYGGVAGKDNFSHHALGVTAHLEYQGLTVNAYQGNYDPRTLEGGNEVWSENTKMQQITTHADVGYSRDLNDKVNLGANLTYNRTEWNSGNFTGGAEGLLYPPQESKGQACLVEAMARIKPMEGLNLVVGGGVESSRWGGENSLVVTGNQVSGFIYMQADYRIQALKLIGGAQYNKLQDIDRNISPRFGAIYDFTPEFGAKVLYSTAFRKAYPNETGFNHWIFRGNPDIKPELIGTLEAQVFYQGRTAQASLTYYQSRMKDTIGRIVVPASNPAGYQYLYTNGGTWDYSGFEVQGRVSLTPRLLLTGSASYQTSEDEDGLTDATLHPNTMVKAGLLYTGSGWSLGVFDAYFGKPKPTDRVNPGSLMINEEPDAYHLVSAKLAWKFLEFGKGGLKLSLEGDNLLDKDIRYPDYPNKAVNSLIPLSSGRSWMASISVLF